MQFFWLKDRPRLSLDFIRFNDRTAGDHELSVTKRALLRWGLRKEGEKPGFLAQPEIINGSGGEKLIFSLSRRTEGSFSQSREAKGGSFCVTSLVQHVQNR